MTPAAGKKGAARKKGRAVGAGVGERLWITDRGKPRSDRGFLHRVVRAALVHGGVPKMPVSLLLTDDEEIGRIHAAFLDDPSPTDVISFALEGAAELVVSVETAARCAKERGHAVCDEVALYVVHGLLHLCGHDDKGVRARARMRRAERAVLSTLGIDIDDVDA